MRVVTLKRLLVLVFVLCGIAAYVVKQVNQEPVVDIVLPLPQEYEEVKTTLNEPADSEAIAHTRTQTQETASSVLPPRTSQIKPDINLGVPFQPQAPHANWDLPYQEACEEASLAMADAYFNNLPLSADQMDERILSLVAWEKKTFGYYEDTHAEEIARMARSFFSMKAVTETDTSAEAIRRHLSNGSLVVLPVAGRLLGNPHFSGEGPLYHVLVVRGYVGDYFITNDPGTRHGEGYLYPADLLLNAIHDWPEGAGHTKDGVTEEMMESGQKIMIVLDR